MIFLMIVHHVKTVVINIKKKKQWQRIRVYAFNGLFAAYIQSFCLFCITTYSHSLWLESKVPKQNNKCGKITIRIWFWKIIFVFIIQFYTYIGIRNIAHIYPQWKKKIAIISAQMYYAYGCVFIICIYSPIYNYNVDILNDVQYG